MSTPLLESGNPYLDAFRFWWPLSQQWPCPCGCRGCDECDDVRLHAGKFDLAFLMHTGYHTPVRAVVADTGREARVPIMEDDVNRVGHNMWAREGEEKAALAAELFHLQEGGT